MYVGETRRSSKWITDANGSFHLPVETAANFMVVNAPGRFPHHQWLGIATEGDTDLGDITLAAGRSIRGRVVDKRTGTPIAGAFVSLRPFQGDPLYALATSVSLHDAKTNGDGLFVLDGMPVGVFRAAAGARGYARRYVEVPSDSAWIDFELDTGATIAGAVVLPDGRPVPSVMMVMHMAGDSGWSEALPDGVFRWQGLNDGKYRLEATTDMGTKVKRVTIRDGRSIENVRMVVRPGGNLSGTITGLVDGERVELAVRSKSAGRTLRGGWRPNGAYSLVGIPAKATLTASTTANRTLMRPVVLDDLGEAQIDLDFSGRSGLAGVVSAAGHPVAGMELAIVPADRSQPAAQATTDRQGRYFATGLSDGRHFLRTRSGQSFEVAVAQQTLFDVEVLPNSLAGVVRLEQAPGRTVPPAAGARVRLERVTAPPQRPLMLHRRIGRDGAFRFDGLLPGDYLVRISAEGHEKASRPVHVAGRKDMRFVLRRATDR